MHGYNQLLFVKSKLCNSQMVIMMMIENLLCPRCCVHACSVTKSCPTFCDSMDSSPPGSSVHGISQARILEWVAIFSSKRSSQPRDQTRVSCTEGRFFTCWAIGGIFPQICSKIEKELNVDTLCYYVGWLFSSHGTYVIHVFARERKTEGLRVPTWYKIARHQLKVKTDKGSISTTYQKTFFHWEAFAEFNHA